MPNRQTLLVIGASALLALILGFMVGRTTAPDGMDSDAAGNPTTTTMVGTTTPPNAEADHSSTDDNPATGGTSKDEVQPYGTPEDRTTAFEVATDLGLTGGLAQEEAFLVAADRICYDLERLTMQGRSEFFATRVVWNQSLAGLSSEDLAGFATTFNVGVTYLCPEHTEFAEAIAYILGI
jgi:hypothetical protein